MREVRRLLFVGCREMQPEDALSRKILQVQEWDSATKNYTLFMIPKPLGKRLSINMESSHTSWQSSPQPDLAALAAPYKESTLKLSLETRNSGDVMIVHCQGRIVYRDEAASL